LNEVTGICFLENMGMMAWHGMHSQYNRLWLNRSCKGTWWATWDFCNNTDCYFDCLQSYLMYNMT